MFHVLRWIERLDLCGGDPSTGLSCVDSSGPPVLWLSHVMDTRHTRIGLRNGFGSHGGAQAILIFAFVHMHALCLLFGCPILGALSHFTVVFIRSHCF